MSYCRKAWQLLISGGAGLEASRHVFSAISKIRKGCIGAMIAVTTVGFASSHDLSEKIASEQTHFSAEDTTVQKPVGIPNEVRNILKRDDLIQSVLGSEHRAANDLPTSWFSASRVHLNAKPLGDLIVIGQPPVSGGNVAMFWVFRATKAGYALVLRISAHDLNVTNSVSNGYRDIEASGATAGTVTTGLYSFNGKVYTEHKEETKPIP